MKRITPENIVDLEDNEIFVFGSNLAGIHGAGAARIAVIMFGAEMGTGYGLQGQSFAIPTKDHKINTLPLVTIKYYVDQFIAFARNNPQYNFLVTKIGCGLAGLQVSEIAPMFKEALELENVFLPLDFLTFINQNN